MNKSRDDQREEGRAAAGPSLSFIQPRQTMRVVRARSSYYSRVVGVLRLALPIVAGVVLLVIFIWPAIKRSDVASIVLKNVPDLVIQNLHFTGLDSKNQPYSMTAVKATRPAGLNNIYDLDRPEGEITLTTGAWIDGKSQYGRYDQDGRKLWLGGNVQLFHDKGYQFTTDEAFVDLNDNNAWGEKPVLIQGDFGEIRGNGFRLLDSGSVMVVKGPAHATLNLRGGSASDKPVQTKN